MKTLLTILLILLIGCNKLTDEYDHKMNTTYTVTTDCYGFTVEYTQACSNNQTSTIRYDSIFAFNWVQQTNVMDTTILRLKVKTLCTGNIKATINHKGIEVSDSCFGWGCEVNIDL